MTPCQALAVASAGTALLLTAAKASATDGPGETRGLPCRPTIACTAEIVPSGALEVEAGSLTRSLSTGRQETFPFLLKLTLAKWVQVQVGSNGYTSAEGAPSMRFFDNLTAGAKFPLLDQGTYRPALAVSAAVGFPVASQDGQTVSDDLFFTAYVTKDIGPLHADFNAGVNAWGLNGTPEPQEWVALALSTSLPPPFGVMAEAYYFSGALPLETRDGGLLFAVSHSPRPWLTFDVGGDVGYFPSVRSFSAFVGMTIIPFVLWKG